MTRFFARAVPIWSGCQRASRSVTSELGIKLILQTCRQRQFPDTMVEITQSVQYPANQESAMSITTGTMTDEQRISVATEFLRRLDTGGDNLELFDDNALYFFPKKGVMRGKDAIAEFFGQLGGIIAKIEHDEMFY